MITVRPAEVKDIPWLLDQLQQFDSFVGAAYPLFPDAETAKETVNALVETQPFFVAESDGELLGFIAGILAPHFFNPRITTLTELLWWVPEQHRGTRTGAMLYDAFMELGKSEANWIIMTLESKSPINPKTLEKRGFRLQEQSYLLEVAR